MLNEVSLVGLVEKIHEMHTNENGNQETIITIKIEKDITAPNIEERYLFVPVVLWAAPAYTAQEICEKGSKLAIKGRIARENGQGLKVISEKITFMDRYFMGRQESK